MCAPYPPSLMTEESRLTCGEASPLVAAGKLYVEVRDQSMDVVVPLHLQAERWGEGQVLRLHCVDVHLLQRQPELNSLKTHTHTSATHISDTPTLMRQALVTSCLGSTTSTRGSLMATSLMQDMSKPYTFSHPDRNKTYFVSLTNTSVSTPCCA